MVKLSPVIPSISVVDTFNAQERHSAGGSRITLNEAEKIFSVMPRENGHIRPIDGLGLHAVVDEIEKKSVSSSVRARAKKFLAENDPLHQRVGSLSDFQRSQLFERVLDTQTLNPEKYLHEIVTFDGVPNAVRRELERAKAELHAEYYDKRHEEPFASQYYAIRAPGRRTVLGYAVYGVAHDEPSVDLQIVAGVGVTPDGRRIYAFSEID